MEGCEIICKYPVLALNNDLLAQIKNIGLMEWVSSNGLSDFAGFYKVIRANQNWFQYSLCRISLRLSESENAMVSAKSLKRIISDTYALPLYSDSLWFPEADVGAGYHLVLKIGPRFSMGSFLKCTSISIHRWNLIFFSHWTYLTPICLQNFDSSTLSSKSQIHSFMWSHPNSLESSIVHTVFYILFAKPYFQSFLFFIQKLNLFKVPIA